MRDNTVEDSEQILSKRVKAHENTAIRELYSNHIGYLSAVCYRYIPNNDDAKDVLQDSFIKILSRFHLFEYRGKGSLRAWMVRIVVNEAIDFIKAKQKMTIIDDNNCLPDIPEEEPDTDDVPATVIQEMIKRLSDGYRTVFNLYVFEKKSHKEIAAILGIKESSSASQYLRARRMLAKWINEYNKTGKEERR